MKLTADKFNCLKTEPADFTGKEFEFDILIPDQPLHIDRETERALKPEIRGVLCLNGPVLLEDDSETIRCARCVSLFLIGNELISFAERFGCLRIEGIFTVRGEFFYKADTDTENTREPRRAVNGFILHEVLSVREKEPPTDLEAYRKRMAEHE